VICSVATVLDELTDTKKKNLPEFHFHRQPKPSAATPNALLQITKQLLLEVSTSLFLDTRTPEQLC